MKVCPTCSGITEETNAIKCANCGRDISKEKEYTKEELEDRTFLQMVDLKHEKAKQKRKITKFLFIFSTFFIICFALLIPLLIEPKGHLEFSETSFTVYVGENVEIVPTYVGSVSGKNVRIEIVESSNDLKEICFRYKIEDNKIIITGLKEDVVYLRISVKDDGKQKNHNNLIVLRILTRGEVNE